MLRLQLGLSGQGNHLALSRHLHLNLRPKPRQHPFGMITGRLAFDHHSLAGGIQPGEQYGRFHLGRGHRHHIADGNRISGPDDGHRQAAALTAIGAGAEQCQRIGDAAHRAAIQRCIASKGRGNRRGRHGAHDQAHPGAGIAAVNHPRRFGKATDPHTEHRPPPRAMVHHLGPKGAHRTRGIQHILTQQQPFDPGLTHRQRPQNERAV